MRIQSRKEVEKVCQKVCHWNKIEEVEKDMKQLAYHYTRQTLYNVEKFE